jgi:hypothetical protein
MDEHTVNSFQNTWELNDTMVSNKHEFAVSDFKIRFFFYE